MLICTVAVWATQGHEPLRPMEAPAQKWPMCCQPSLPGRLLAGLLGGAGRVSRYGQSLRPAHLLPKLLSTDSLALTSVQGGCPVYTAASLRESPQSTHNTGHASPVKPARVVCLKYSVQFSRPVASDSATVGTAARQASLSFTNSRNLLKLISIVSVMPSNHLILFSPSPFNISQHQGLFK